MLLTILNDDIKWISFHGAYDFAYLLKVITNQLLPDKESGFLELMEVYFLNFYDVRYLVKNNFRGSLSKLAQEFDIMRIGSQHQAGSDSVLTAEIYFILNL
jgi:CCR4-NOT transcription complex subunit 7/8